MNLLSPTKSSIFLAIALIFTSFIEKQPAEKKKWDANSPLKWADYQSPIDRNSRNYAHTYYSADFTYKKHLVNNKVQIKFLVVCTMDPMKSWAIQDKETPALLTHEQLHFDIAEFFARKLEDSFNHHSYSVNFQKEIDSIGENVMSKRYEMEERYDRETNHCLDINMQAKWEKFVHNLILNKNSYSIEQGLEKEVTLIN